MRIPRSTFRLARQRFRLGALLLSTTCLLALARSPLVGAPWSEARPFVESRAAFECQGKSIAIERFEPTEPGKHPAVLVLHGSAGMTLGGPPLRELARRLAAHGYVAHVVHYFDRTGTKFASLDAAKTNFETWARTIAEAVTRVSSQENVDPDRVALVGYSLGAYLSVTLGVFDPRVGAVVEFSGGMPEPLLKEVRSLPPTLILHGAADIVVPVAEARALEKLCKERDIPHVIKIYEGQGHGFIGPDAEDATHRTLAFLDTHFRASPIRRHEVARPRFSEVSAGPEAKR